MIAGMIFLALAAVGLYVTVRAAYRAIRAAGRATLARWGTIRRRRHARQIEREELYALAEELLAARERRQALASTGAPQGPVPAPPPPREPPGAIVEVLPRWYAEPADGDARVAMAARPRKRAAP